MNADKNDAARVDLSWVLPLYRTAAQLEELVARIHRVSAGLGVRHEIVLVDDACPEDCGGLAQRMAAQQQHRNPEEGFGRDVGLDDLAVRRDHQDRMRQRVEHRVGGLGRERDDLLGVTHAAILQPNSS